MNKLLTILLLFTISLGIAQQDDQRISNIKSQLELLSVDNVGLTENVKTEINVSNITLANFLLAISEVHHININVATELNQISIANNFANVTVADLLVFLCKEYQLSIDFTGNILSIKPFEAPVIEQRIIPIDYNPDDNTISLDVKGDKLYDVFKRIMDETGKNLVFSPGLENRSLTMYLQQTPFDAAMDKLAFANNLYTEKTKDNFYLFEAIAVGVQTNQLDTGTTILPAVRQRKGNFFFKIINPETKVLDVDIVNTPIATIINDIGNELDIDVFTATPLENAGSVSFKAKGISFDELLHTIFGIQTVSPTATLNSNNQNTNGRPQNTALPPSDSFTFKKEGNIYYFGTENQLSVRKVEIIHLQHRSVELLADPAGGGNRNTSRGRNQGNYNNSFSNSNSSNQFDNVDGTNRNRQPLNTNASNSFGSYGSKAEALVNILPDEIKQDLEIKIDYELNSFYVNGPSAKIERFKQFINDIDKPVPVILIEVMFIEVSKSATVETGISWGIGDAPAQTQGAIFPETNLTLGASTINKVIGGFDGFGSFNLGKVIPNFFATIKAMEANGNIKIRSTPKLSTLNGHRATFSNGETSYYAVTQRNIYGTDNPQTSEITNYEPIDAELGLTIKPLVSGDGQVTLDIFVIQSSFGERISNDAPPNISSREFSSIIRVKDQDIVVLGGLEEQLKNDSGSGVPLLSRIPILKWLFSKRKRLDSKSKLTVLIKPTVFY